MLLNLRNNKSTRQTSIADYMFGSTIQTAKAWNKSGLGKRLTPFTIRVPHDIKFLNLSMWRRE
jgi:hypothetical protein